MRKEEDKEACCRNLKIYRHLFTLTFECSNKCGCNLAYILPFGVKGMKTIQKTPMSFPKVGKVSEIRNEKRKISKNGLHFGDNYRFAQNVRRCNKLFIVFKKDP